MKYLKLFEAYQLKNGVLDVSNKNLTSLDELPDGLLELRCYGNQLTTLPELSDGLREINCNNNNIQFLPKLPDSLKKLSCDDNKLTSLPELPDGLIILHCENRLKCLIPTKFIPQQGDHWLSTYYYIMICSYEFQKNILDGDVSKMKELVEQIDNIPPVLRMYNKNLCIHPDIKKEFDFALNGVNLNLL